MIDIKTNILEWSNSKFSELGEPLALNLKPLRQEASFRRYFRLERKEDSIIGVYSPPELESNKEFIFLSNLLRENGVNVPLVHAFDLDSGFMIVSDFGDDLLQFKINRSNAFELYQCAFKEMILINSIPKHDNFSFLTEQEILKQMSLFEEWFLKGLLGISLNKKEKSYLEFIFDQIVQIFFEQPQVLCHFDFETRNLLALPGNRLGVLDFQDAVVGPLFLDPSSLLKDLHFDSTYEEVFKFLDIYLEKAIKVGLLSEQEIDKVPRWFDLTSLQRQLRILGTLSRLHLRDKKSYRIKDLEKTLKFMIETCSKNKDLNEFSIFLKKRISNKLSRRIKELL